MPTNKILVPIDLNHDATFGLVFPVTRQLARFHSARLHLLSVVPTELALWPYVPHGFLEETRKLTETQLKDLGELNYGDEIDWRSEALTGAIAATIVDRASELGVGLIAIASHDPNFADRVLGGTASRVLSRAHCAVLVLRPGGIWHWDQESSNSGAV